MVLCPHPLAFSKEEATTPQSSLRLRQSTAIKGSHGDMIPKMEVNTGLDREEWGGLSRGAAGTE